MTTDELILGVTEDGLNRMAVYLYIGWGPRGSRPAWASLDESERNSWRMAAWRLLEVATEDQA